MRPAARSPLRDALGSSLLRAAQPTHRRAPARAAAALADPAAAADHAAAALALPPAAALLHLGDLAPWAAAAARRAAVVADAAAAALPAASPPGAAAAADAPKDDGFLAPLVHGLEFVLARIRAALDAAHVPYSYGWSVVALTAAVKAATLPLVKQQVESTLSVQALKPQIDAIKAKYGEDKDAVSRETSALYEKAKVNPLAGCLPTLATLPIFIGLYRSLTASLDAAGPGADGGAATDLAFYWIPTLAGPTSVAAQRAGAGAAWLLPLVDGAPPVGWETAARYLVLPAAVVAAQYATSAIIAPPVDKDAENAGVQKALQLGLPLMVGWFSLNVPSGLTLYYFCNTLFTGAIQIYLKKLGGAAAAEFDLGPIELGRARRSGVAALATASANGETEAAGPSEAGGEAAAAAAAFSAGGAAAGGAAAAAEAEAEVEAAAAAPPSRRCKRLRRELLEA